MSSDADYAAFLDKANEQNVATSSSRDKNRFSAKAVDTDVPEELKAVGAYYTSDSDEPFEPVSLKWVGKDDPTKGMFFLILDESQLCLMPG